MEVKYSKVTAREIREAVVEMYGNIGEKINGDYLASEINLIDKSSDTLTFRINSMGGNVIQGLSIVGAIVGAKAETVAIIEGIAGSMSGIIALSCKKVRMNDFARIMLHSPYFQDNNGDQVKNLTEDEKNAIDSMKSILVDILSRRGKSTTEIEAILSKDTWYNATQALKEGFVDEIIDTGFVKATARLNAEKLVAFATEKFTSINNDEMKKIAAKLGLPESSDEQAIIAAIDQKETALADSRTKLVDAVIVAGKKSGIVNDSNLESMKKLGGQDLNLLIDLVVKPVAASDNARLSEIVAEVQKTLGDGKKADEKDWDWFQKNDPQALMRMKAAEPERYNKLYKAYWEK